MPTPGCVLTFPEVGRSLMYIPCRPRPLVVYLCWHHKYYVLGSMAEEYKVGLYVDCLKLHVTRVSTKTDPQISPPCLIPYIDFCSLKASPVIPSSHVEFVGCPMMNSKSIYSYRYELATSTSSTIITCDDAYAMMVRTYS